MSETEAPIKHPTQILSDDIFSFTQDIECLHTTLPLIMIIMGTVHEETHKSFHTFIDEHSENIETGEENTYALKVEDAAEHDRLKRQHNNSLTAMRLIPRHFITSLVSQYDSFLGRVIRFIFAIKPQILNASEKNIAYTDLILFANIDAAREYIIEKEVETIIRKSHVEQFAWLKDKLGTPFNKDLKSWPVFIELTECRNLFVHCDGRVSSQYLKVCSENKCDIAPTLNVGDQLKVNPQYFEDAYKCIYEIGVKLAHVIWRRLSPDHLKEADDNIIAITYGLLEKREFDLAKRLLDFFTQDHMKHSSDVNRRMMIINRAQAYKWAKDNDTCNKILSKLDWSASGDNFKLAVAVLKENYDDAYNLMKRLKHDETFLKTYYKDWPLFMELRKQEAFASVYEECYGEPFKVQQKTEEEKKENVEQYNQPDAE
jgi:hypothetical protein